MDFIGRAIRAFCARARRRGYKVSVTPLSRNYKVVLEFGDFVECFVCSFGDILCSFTREYNTMCCSMRGVRK